MLRQPRTSSGSYRLVGTCATLLVLAMAGSAFASGATPALQVEFTPVRMDALSVGGGGGPRGTCPPVDVTLSDANFAGGSFIIQGGFVEGEIAAATYNLTALEFPIIVNTMEMVFASNQNTETISVHWSVLVWSGVPSDANPPVRTFSSDDLILPHITMPPSASPQGVIVSVSVAPDNPDPIVIPNDGSNKFSVGFRIDQHHAPATGPCCFGLIPQHCCPAGDPPCDGVSVGSNNAFPTVDAGGRQFPTQNWLYCMTGCGALAACSGWNSNAAVGMSGDWNIRASYDPFDCPGIGACCEPTTGSCTLQFQGDCTSQGGIWQGEASPCTPNPCPQPTGACCKWDGTCQEGVEISTCDIPAGETFFVDTLCAAVEPCPLPPGACCTPDGFCADGETTVSCAAQGGTFLGVGAACLEGNATCDGACCNPSSGFCTEVPVTLCLGANEFQGHGTACVGVGLDECPTGSCCNPDGTCTITTPAGCAPPSVYTDGATCGPPNPCPQPVGACCFSPGCAEPLSQVQCIGLGGTWAGEGTVCPDACAATCPPGSDPGNMNGDLTVDAADIQGFTDCMLGVNTDPSVTCDCGDFDQLNGVDMADLAPFVAALLGP